ncbi:dihydrodipicolinate reductase C-terminal domain-containing protein [Curvibacter sp. HBC61]|uniref:4-hydroxy-tetrahydrodipicolinate reductase n=1 Tax=Curvibacter cyanobacteriorum TaxID=3026422 RepID=A0ABT5N264_9BURK|nr:dihydrodipicolinate reductase C-terminal domain-containing protein [Curvibacter sp. HBC61]MDD0840394.1 dihydrodipicolinate reductase C-terminal domain-containing protein [Curvibacter sp. HBC61]
MNTSRITVGLLGFGKAGRAVAQVLASDPQLELKWIARRHAAPDARWDEQPAVRFVGLQDQALDRWLDAHPVQVLVDFSRAETLALYVDAVRQRQTMLVTAISAYSDAQREVLRALGQDCRVMSSPNITLGINFLLTAAKLLRSIAPLADVEIVEQHFRDKPEVSGTARIIAEGLNVDDDKITSLRLGGIVGHHEVIFGFPHQTVRLIHDSIRREAFGTGAAFAIKELAQQPPGFYAFEDLLSKRIAKGLLASA